MIRLEGTTATRLRDSLIKLRNDRHITLTDISAKLPRIWIPDWLCGQILQMCDYRKYERVTCPVEQAMGQAVIAIILDRVIKENTDGQTEKEYETGNGVTNAPDNSSNKTS